MNVFITECTEVHSLGRYLDTGVDTSFSAVFSSTRWSPSLKLYRKDAMSNRKNAIGSFFNKAYGCSRRWLRDRRNVIEKSYGRHMDVHF